ncbi:MAG: hypothetical protein AAF291_16645 [Pseudomonadota bacterium]
MTDTAPGTEPRDALRAKIEARERRIAERTLAEEARDAAEVASEYVKQHPLQVIGGAVALGLLIGLMTKPGRRAVGNAASGTANAVSGVASGASSGAAKKVGSAAMSQSSRFATLVADAIVAYGIKLIDDILDGARAGKEKAEDLSDAASATARTAKREAAHAAGTAADKTRAMGQRTRRRATRAVRNMADRIS